jgi:hypothetical protein
LQTSREEQEGQAKEEAAEPRKPFFLVFHTLVVIDSLMS